MVGYFINFNSAYFIVICGYFRFRFSFGAKEKMPAVVL
jgi:hypothetical protein